MASPPLHSDLTCAATLHPERLAVSDGRSSLTFAELDVISTRLAYHLLAAGAVRGDRIAYFLRRGTDCVTAALGILKSGGAYVPIDHKIPVERWRRIVEDACPAAVVCNAATLAETIERVREMVSPTRIVCLGSAISLSESGVPKVLFTEETPTPVRNLPAVSGDDLAYVLYTSGSTGAPKGVIITHANVANYIDWAVEYFSITSEDRILGTAPFHFDMSTFDIFSALRAAAPLLIATEEHILFPDRLANLIEKERITLWKGVSSLLMYMCRVGVVAPGRMPSMRRVIFAGEPLATKYLARWMEVFPDKSFFNAYGPTETTGISLCYRVLSVPTLGDPIPIGSPCRGASVLLLAEDGTPVHAGEPGELYIGGPGVGKGYLNDPERTACHFTPHPLDAGSGVPFYRTGDLVRVNADGEYVFLSRKDHQVKWMGYRIELAEIESALLSHPGVRDAAVLLQETGRDDLTELVGFFEGEDSLETGDLQHHLRQVLPSYMIPKCLVRLSALPRNDRGKIARDRLQMEKVVNKEARAGRP